LGAATAGLVVTGSVGCVSVKDHNKALVQRDVMEIQRDRARAEANGLQAQLDSYQAQVGFISDKDSVIETLSADNANLRGQLAEINNKYGEAMDGVVGAALPAEVKDALASFAASNRDLVEFDAAKGVMRFMSDATFSKGSADLTPKGQQVAAALAKILSSGNAAGYELMVAGHTDGMPVSNPKTIAAGHKDNWHLSAHRAIALGKVLQSNHVSARRMAMVGYADQRPVASNASEAGRSQNRRVEVVVLAARVDGTTPSPVAKAAPMPMAATPQPTASVGWSSHNEGASNDTFEGWSD
jgi:chemotaxis protein MotB